MLPETRDKSTPLILHCMFEHDKSDKRTYKSIRKDKIGQWDE